MEGHKLCRVIKVTGPIWKEGRCFSGHVDVSFAWVIAKDAIAGKHVKVNGACGWEISSVDATPPVATLE